MTKEGTILGEAANPAAIERTILERIDRRAESGTALALPQRTVTDTIARYEGDALGTAMALDLSQALLPEVGSDGVLDEIDVDVIDRIVEILEANELVGIPYEDVARVLGVNLEHGSLFGLATIADQLSGADTSQALLELLHSEFGFSGLADQEEREAFLRDSVGDLEAEDDDYVEDGDDEAEGDEDTVTDDSGEEFEL